MDESVLYAASPNKDGNAIQPCAKDTAKGVPLIVFDTEGSGGQLNEICQLAYLLVDGARLTGRNFFFQVSEMNPYAQAKHGFSIHALSVLSKGLRFRDCAEEIYQDFSLPSKVAGHNVQSDVQALRTAFSRVGLVWQARVRGGSFRGGAGRTGYDGRRL